MQKYYHMNIAGVDHELPICPLNDKLCNGNMVFSRHIKR